MKALIAMSGGVDSSVAAYLAQREGYECIGCTMKLYTNTDAGISERHTCCSLDALFRRAEELGCEKIVTGHYARIARAGERYILQKALDETKDQSYVLYAMTQRELAHTLFPLGAMRKSETRAIAETQGFGNARKRDSQDICFAPDGDYAAAIGRLTGEKSVPGAFVSTDGRVLGEHKGIIHYTVGQRRGLGISHGERLYVCRIDPERNEAVLGEEKDLYRSEAAVSDVNWISGETPREPVRCAVKIRYRAREQAATVYPEENGRGRIVSLQGTLAAIRFDAPGETAPRTFCLPAALQNGFLSFKTDAPG